MPNLWYTISFETKLPAPPDAGEMEDLIRECLRGYFAVDAFKVTLASGEMGPIPGTIEVGDLVRLCHGDTLGTVTGFEQTTPNEISHFVEFPWGNQRVGFEHNLVLVAKADKAEETKAYYGQKPAQTQPEPPSTKGMFHTGIDADDPGEFGSLD